MGYHPNNLYRLHLFLDQHLFYPLVLSSLLACSLFAGRAFIIGHFTLKGILWNLFLAWVPYLFSLMATVLYHFFPRRAWLLLVPGFFWLIFFPNAPYIITDLEHLHDYSSVPLWYDIGLLATFAWAGCFLAIASLRNMQLLVKANLGSLVSWLFVGYTLLLGGLGMFLGRFSRWNSWDLFTRPGAILAEVFKRFTDPLDNLRFFGFTFLFSALLLVVYLMFISIRKGGDVEA